MNEIMHPSALLWRFWDAVVGPSGWRSVIGPLVFVIAGISLLVYDHVNEKVSDLVFWLTLGLILTIFLRILETNRRQSRELYERQRDALEDRVTSLPNRLRLEADLAKAVAEQAERRTLVLLELEGLQAYGDRLGYEAGDELLRHAARRIVDAVQPFGGVVYRFDTARLAAFAPGDERRLGEVVLAATDSLQVGEAGPPITRSYGEVTVPDEAGDAQVAFRLAGQRLDAHKQRQHRSARRQAHAVLMAALTARHPMRRDLLRAVAYRSISVARRIGLDAAAIDDIALAAELQDVGLLAAPDHAIATEPGLHGNGGGALVHGHTTEGAEIVGAAPGLAAVAEIVRACGERYDGSGYPDGLSGEAIPIGARIIAASAAFAALTAPRGQLPAMGPGEALDELRRQAGTRFDPGVVAALARDFADEALPSPAPAPVA